MRKCFAATLLFLSVLAAVTYPWIFNLGRYISGFHSSDEPFGTIWRLWDLNCAFRQGAYGLTDSIAYPYGADFYSHGMTAYLNNAVSLFLSLFFTPVTAYNLLIILSFALTFLFTFILVSHISKNTLAAFFSGIAFSLSPQHFARAWQHPGIAHFEWLPLAIYSAILLREKGGVKPVILFVISLIFVLSFDFTIAYLGMFSVLLFIFYSLSTGFLKKKQGLLPVKKNLELAAKYFFALAAAFLLLFPQIYGMISAYARSAGKSHPSAFNLFHRPFEDLFVQSAKPLGYLLPPSTHPFFGGFSGQFIGCPLYGISLTEHVLFLGWVVLFLSVFAWRRLKKNSAGEIAPEEKFYLKFFLLLAIGSWVFSQPPWWQLGPVKLYMPSFFLYKVLPMFRAYCRFGIVTMLGVCVLAGFGLKFLLANKKANPAFVVFFLLCCALLFEFWNYPPYKVIDVSRAPQVYQWLKDQPAQIIAEYPMDIDTPNELYKFYQLTHKKKIVNGAIPGSLGNEFGRSIVKLSAPQTAEKLRKINVKYALVHRDGYLSTELLEDRNELQGIAKNKNLRLIKSFQGADCPDPAIMCVEKSGPVDVYEITVE
jgi:hypothetical protein